MLIFPKITSTMLFVTYLYQKVIAVVIRAIFRYGNPIHSTPNDVYQIKSRDLGRTIKAHVYKPRSASSPNPSPVLINFHGSGFILPMHGQDDEFCQQICRETGYTVLDVQYRLAPEHPFPAALQDTEDAVNWVLQRPDQFDQSRIAISGFSAGGNLALGACSNLFPQETFRSVLAFYPVVDLYTEPGDKATLDPDGKPLPDWLSRFFNGCYIPSAYDRRDPRISPLYAQPDRFPSRVLIITAAGDNLAGEAEALAANIGKQPRREVVSHRMQGCNHAWDKEAPKGSVQGDAKEKAYAMAVALLSQ
jgi:acetyl esterase/lipase